MAAGEHGHKTTAAALKSRGLVTVRGHGPTWQAAVTEDGRHFLEHGTYPHARAAAKRPAKPASRSKKKAAAPSEPALINEKATTTLKEGHTTLGRCGTPRRDPDHL